MVADNAPVITAQEKSFSESKEFYEMMEKEFENTCGFEVWEDSTGPEGSLESGWMLNNSGTEEVFSVCVFLAKKAEARARQQAFSEGQEEMRRYMEQKIKEAKEIAFSEGRKAGLKEMDEAWGLAHYNASHQHAKKLRQEYSAK